MAKCAGFSGYWWDKEFQDLPPMIYYKHDKELDLSRSSVNIVPSGLEGVDTIRLRDKPIAIAPDFTGTILYEWSSFCFPALSADDAKKARLFYQKNQQFCETPHTWAGNSPHSNYNNIPNNMRFVTVDQRTFLDLRECNVSVKRSSLWIGGVKALMLPTDRADKAKRLLKRMRCSARQRQ